MRRICHQGKGDVPVSDAVNPPVVHSQVVFHVTRALVEGTTESPQGHEWLLGHGRRQRSTDLKAGRGGHFLQVLPQYSRHSLQELNWHPGKPVPGAKPLPTSDMHPAHLNTAEGVGDEASVVGWAKTLNNR